MVDSGHVSIITSLPMTSTVIMNVVNTTTYLLSWWPTPMKVRCSHTTFPLPNSKKTRASSLGSLQTRLCRYIQPTTTRRRILAMEMLSVIWDSPGRRSPGSACRHRQAKPLPMQPTSRNPQNSRLSEAKSAGVSLMLMTFSIWMVLSSRNLINILTKPP